MKVVSTVKTIEEALNVKYYIDFYQREYSWYKENIESLLDDIYHRFDLSFDKNEDITKNYIKTNYKWYYINTYTINTIQDRCCLVDGQQRLTTLTLFLIKIYHLAKKFNLNAYKVAYIEKAICVSHGNGYSFWLGDQNRDKTLNTIFQKDISSQNEIPLQYGDASNKKIVENYLFVSKYFNTKFPHNEDDEEKTGVIGSKLEAYLYYLLNNVNLVEINVTDSEDVAMVFEVINAKGQKLKSFEIIKAQLLSKIKKEELDTYLNIWNECINKLHNSGLDVDSFFIALLKSRYTTTPNELKTGIPKDYHKIIFKFLDLSKERFVKDFIASVLKHYIKLYIEINESNNDNSEYSAVYFNHLNKLNNQVLPILSAITTDEIKSNTYKLKLDLVSKLIDRHFSLQKLFNCYNSNNFNTQQQQIILNIRDKTDLKEIKDIVDTQLLKNIKDESMQNDLNSFFHYPFFESFAYDQSSDTRIFIKYFSQELKVF